MISRAEFEAYLNTVDTGEFDERMKRQEEKGKIFSICWYTLFVVVALITTVLVAKHMYWAFAFLLVCILALSLGLAGKSIFTGKVFSDFDAKFRDRFMAKLLEGYSYKYSRNHYISEAIYSRLGFTSTGDDYDGQDLLEIEIPNKDGEPSGCWLRICDLHITEEHTYTDKDGNTHTETETIYSGAFGYVVFKEEFKCALGLDAMPSAKGLKRIKLEDIEFNKKFHLLSTDQLETLRILTPDMMQKVMALDKRVRRLAVMLQRNAMSIGFAKNLFEPTRKEKKSLAEMYLPLYDDVEILVKIVEEIRRNKKVFKI